jgi:esterase/lipase
MRSVLRWLAVLLAVLLVFVSVIWLVPERLPDLQSAPPDGFTEAVGGLEARVAADADASINPECRERVYVGDGPTEQVIVLFHGFTSCPKQFEALAEELHAAGHNVVVPRLPRHGLADRLTRDLRHLTADEMLGLTAEVVALARPLGNELVVAGLSGGGSMSMWAAQRIEAIDRVVLMAPLVGIGAVPDQFTKPVTNLARLIPSQRVWWDGEGQAESPRIVDYSYPAYETKGIGQVLRIGVGIYDEARSTGPASNDIVVVTNANDNAVNGAEIDKLLARWQGSDPDLGLIRFEFPADLGLPHDFVTLEHPDADPDTVYPVLVEALTGDPSLLDSLLPEA